MNTKKFRKIIWDYYKENKRYLPWRKTRDPYKILVSEIMLQQTQVSRVEPKYKAFLKKFPTVSHLAKAKTKDVLLLWQGLGYNRRALYLKKCAEKIDKDFAGKFPKDFKTLRSFPGIGPATAGDLMIFAWNVPMSVIETNVRSVFIYFFFSDKTNVHDKDIFPLVEKTLDRENPREWYYALFDYGVYLKKKTNPSRQSVHYAKQSKFIGSYRQKRAHVLRVILEDNSRAYSVREIQKIVNYDISIISKILSELEQEGFIKKVKGNLYKVA